MTKEKLIQLLDNVDWTEVHQMRIDDHGRRVELWLEEDKLVPVTMEQNTWQSGVESIGSLPCWGLGNIDSTIYTEGWTETVNDDEHYLMYRVTVEESMLPKGSIHDLETIVQTAIKESEWQTDYEEWQQNIIENWEHDVEFNKIMRS